MGTVHWASMAKPEAGTCPKWGMRCSSERLSSGLPSLWGCAGLPASFRGASPPVAASCFIRCGVWQVPLVGLLVLLGRRPTATLLETGGPSDSRTTGPFLMLALAEGA